MWKSKVDELIHEWLTNDNYLGVLKDTFAGIAAIKVRKITNKVDSKIFPKVLRNEDM